MKGTATARANIALAKYWGKCDAALNLPAVPSVSLTLDALRTDTEVVRDPSLREDHVSLDGVELTGGGAAKLRTFMDLLRARAGVDGSAPDRFARVSSHNRFPTASGLASSASGFAALAAAGARAYAWDADTSALSSLARRGSASAARSLYGGWVELPAGALGEDHLPARPLHPEGWWDVALVVALATRAPKSVASRDGMKHTAQTSPYYAAWLSCAPGYAHEVKRALAARDLEALGAAMEASTMAMHACAWAAVPAVRYARGITLELLDAVESLRREGVGAWATMDAGPHVKTLCAAADVPAVERALRAVPGVVDVLIARPGGGVEVS
ncbi:MAG: diphosphomevalonate decarboxylase [Polyangiales bacterium]